MEANPWFCMIIKNTTMLNKSKSKDRNYLIINSKHPGATNEARNVKNPLNNFLICTRKDSR